MKESLNRIEDQELALDMAYAEKPLRDLAARAIDMGYDWGRAAYEAATSSAITAGKFAEEFYREKHANEARWSETIAQLSEIDPGKDVFVTRANLVSYALAHGFTQPRAYDAFNVIRNNKREFSEVELLNVVSEDRELLRLDARVVSFVRTLLTAKQLELIESYYAAS